MHDKQETLRELTVFGLLLAIGIAGRWAQPTWNFTPLAAVTIVGGFYFRHLLPAVLLPVTILAVSDLLLPVHDSMAVMICVHLMMILSLWLGRGSRGAEGLEAVKRFGMCAVIPSSAFFLVTNFAVWAVHSSYEKTLAGLAACYAAGLPFYRWMLAGDAFYLTVLVSCLIVATVARRRRALQPVPVRVR